MAEKKLESIVLTENSAKKLKEIAKEKGFLDERYRIRIGVKAGGCAGLSYQLDILEEKEYQTLIVLQRNIKFREMESQGLNIVVDNKSYLFLIGITVDYDHFLGFKYSNPEAKASCGCGTSFSTKQPEKDDESL